MNDLLILMHKHGTDKADHRADIPYETLLGSRRNEVCKVLEIGVRNGASLRVWEDYFPNAEVFGIDVLPDCAKVAGKSKVFIGNAYDEKQMKPVFEELGTGFDLIVDDGSHQCVDQVKALKMYWPLLKPHGGIFVIEDLFLPYRYKWACYHKPTNKPPFDVLLRRRIENRLKNHRSTPGSPAICVFGGLVAFIKNEEGPGPDFDRQRIRGITGE